MAVEGRGAERRELKMGRSKFPGKPSRFLFNRKRVNLSSCDLPEHNSSSLAAERIALGLSLYQNTFEDGVMDGTDSFCGFSLEDAESALTELRVHQKKIEKLQKKEGSSVKGSEHFHAELSKCFKKTCFDGGGKLKETFSGSATVCDGKTNNRSANDRWKSLLSSSKSLQSQAAKRILDKAKKITAMDGLEKKFVLPNRSVHSSRMIKPTKRFLDGENSKEAPKKMKLDQKTKTADVEQPVRPAGKVILREPRLQLCPTNTSLREGPFSTPTAGSLNPNTLRQRVGPIVCGVCGVTRFYKFAKHARKFGLLTCDLCRQFVTEMLRRRKTAVEANIVKCLKGTGLCFLVPGVVRSPQWNSMPNSYEARCPACWLKLCLRNFKISSTLKQQLALLLPDDMRRNLDGNLPWAHDVKPFMMPEGACTFFNRFNVNSETKSSLNNERVSPKPTKPLKAKEERRQRVPLPGPRVKHVCRSASVALGQPQAIFPEKSESEPVPEVIPAAESSDAAKSSSAEPLKSIVEGKLSASLEFSNKEKALETTARGEHRSKKKSADDVETDLISLDFWENYDPDEVCEMGFSLIGSAPFSVRALCFLCGSAGKERLIHCACCCEPYHEFCIGDSHMKSLLDTTSSVNKQQRWLFDWICPRCTSCAACGKPSGQQLRCVKCDNSYHVDCVGTRLPYSPDRPWTCAACLRCKSCNAVDVTVFVGNLPLCKPCFVLRQKGNFCPLCQKCYEDDDYECKMMECGTCRSWVHAKCEGVSDERYQVLSFLPESVEFICRMCCAMPPAPWWLAVESELKAGYLGVLKALSKNRTACRMLRWSPRKVCSCRRRTSTASTGGVEEDAAAADADVEIEGEETSPGDDSGLGLSNGECLCFLEVDSYSSRSKPFASTLFSIRKKVMDCEYSSLAQFHEDMRSMVETTQSDELKDVYHTVLKEVFPWFDPKCGGVLNGSRSLENSPVKASPIKKRSKVPDYGCLVPYELLEDRPLDYFYSGIGAIEDTRVCAFCKEVGDGLPDETGRLLYCGQNDWIHCNCAIWSAEVFEEIDGSLQNVHAAISRSRLIRCARCGERGASIGCCARGCGETQHLRCARLSQFVFCADDKSVYCATHAQGIESLNQAERKEFEMRRCVYVELEKRRRRRCSVREVRVGIGGTIVEELGRVCTPLSDLEETIMPVDFRATKLYWSSKEPWRVVKYTFSVRLVEPEQNEGIDLGVNFTVDHSQIDNLEFRLKQLEHFQLYHTLLPCTEDGEAASQQPALEEKPQKPNLKRPKRRIFDPLEESENQDLLPPELEEAIFKDLPHDILDGISMQDIFLDIGEKETDSGVECDKWPANEEMKERKGIGTFRHHLVTNWNNKGEPKWKKKPQEGKENKMVSWCGRLLQVDGAVDSSSGSEAGGSPSRALDMPHLDYNSPSGQQSAIIPQLDGQFDDGDDEDDDDDNNNDESNSLRRESLDGEEHPVECSTCKCTYRTQRSYEKHLESRCHALLMSSSSSEDEEEEPPKIVPPENPVVQIGLSETFKCQISPPMPPTVTKTLAKPRTYTRKRPQVQNPSLPKASPPRMTLPQPQITLVAQTQPQRVAPQPILLQTAPATVPVILQEPMVPTFQPLVQYIVDQSKNIIMPGGYQVVMPPSPVVINQSPVFEVVTDPRTGNVFLATPSQPPPPPQPVMYNMETIVSNTVMHTNQFMSSSFSQTSTQVFQASKMEQVVNIQPSNFVMTTAPSEPLYCVSMPTTTAQIAPVPPLAPAPQWSIPKTPPKPMIVRSQIPPTVSVRPTANPKPPPVKVKPRSCALVDYINNFRSDAPDPPSPPLPPPPPPPPPPIPVTISLPTIAKKPSPPVRVVAPVRPMPPRVVVPPAKVSPEPPVKPVKAVKSVTTIKVDSPVKSPAKPTPNISMPLLDDSPPPSNCDIIRTSPVPASVTSSLPMPMTPLTVEVASVPNLTTVQSLPSPRPFPPLPNKLSISPVRSNKSPTEKVVNTSSPPVVKKSPEVKKVKSSEEKVTPETGKPVVKQSLADATNVQNTKTVRELKITPRVAEPEGPKLVYDVVTDDGFKFSSTSLSEVWLKICESVQEMRSAYKMPPISAFTPRQPHHLLGLGNHGVQHVLEQLPNVGFCVNYKRRYFRDGEQRDLGIDAESNDVVKESRTGCIRSDGYAGRKETDMFSWLASRYRLMPKVQDFVEDHSNSRRTTHLPMAMRYRILRESSKKDLFVYRSKIHGMGLFCMREIEAGEMVIEYAGQLIRSSLTDKREKQYTDRGIGCYMFRIDDHYVVDATINGNAARFINHSCEPNCYSRVVDILGKKHIIIFALRKIAVMEELTYDYKFPFEDEKISCHCLSKKCRKYLN